MTMRPSYALHSQGPEVARIQTALKELGLYRGPIDGDFGGGTDAAVRAFQRSKGLVVDGVVGPNTWSAMFDGTPISEPAITGYRLEYRCLGLTGAFETDTAPPGCFAGLSGDFDGQGMSFGVLQWNLGQGSLQPLLLEIDRSNRALLRQIFGACYAELQAMLNADLEDQLMWARSVQDLQSFRLLEPWRGMFKTLGRTTEFQSIEVRHALGLFQDARNLCREFDLHSERAVALMFDIKVQNGGIKRLVRPQIQRDFGVLDPALGEDDLEVARIRIVANRCAESANYRWIEDVRARKLTIANGVGNVHGRYYDLAGQYAIGLTVAA